MELFFDTETTGKAVFKAPHTDPGQPDIIQLGAVLSDQQKVYTKLSVIINPTDISPNWVMPEEVEKIHGISAATIRLVGCDATPSLKMLIQLIDAADSVVCHNYDFDAKMVLVALFRAKLEKELSMFQSKRNFCTMKYSTNIVKLPGPYGYKWPKLIELHQFLFNEGFEGAHDALNDVLATRRCYYELINRIKS